jgi:glycosyltransferase involved in cell wall biosynthesis
LRTQPYFAEVIVVENGSTDRTYEVAAGFQKRMPFLRVIQDAGRGKGLAVRRGMLEAAGEYRIFCDVDFSMPVEEIAQFIPPALPDMDVAIASRELKGAVRYNEPALRHFIGRGFNTLVRWMTLPGLQDTQCGFKCFRAEVAERVFPLQTIDGWTFDVEVLYIARRMGYKIVEVPIPGITSPKARCVFERLIACLPTWSPSSNAARGCMNSRFNPADLPLPELTFEQELWGAGCALLPA